MLSLKVDQIALRGVRGLFYLDTLILVYAAVYFSIHLLKRGETKTAKLDSFGVRLALGLGFEFNAYWRDSLSVEQDRSAGASAVNCLLSGLVANPVCFDGVRLYALLTRSRKKLLPQAFA